MFYLAVVVQVATPNETLDEQNFQRIVDTDHMRQWYKHRVAYAMMEDGWRRPT